MLTSAFKDYSRCENEQVGKMFFLITTSASKKGHTNYIFILVAVKKEAESIFSVFTCQGYAPPPPHYSENKM